jgi:hypothetical protein
MTHPKADSMLRPSLVILAALLSATLLGVVGCDESGKRPQEPAPIASRGAPPFQPPSYPAGRRIDTIATARLDGSRIPLFVVGSRSDSLAGAARFDLLEVFAFDSLRGAWTRVLVDSVKAARSIELSDVTGDGHDDLVVGLDYGGNEPVATFGMHVYSAHGGALRRVFRSTYMDPRIDTIPGVAGRVIMARHALWPLFAPRSDASIYTDDIFAYRDGRFRSIVGEARGYFRAEADSALARYLPLRDSVERELVAARQRAAHLRDSLARIGDTLALATATPRDTLTYGQELRLYETSALVVLHRVRSGDERGARAFWSQQRAFLRSVLREEQFDELAAFNEQLLSPG